MMKIKERRKFNHLICIVLTLFLLSCSGSDLSEDPTVEASSVSNTAFSENTKYEINLEMEGKTFQKNVLIEDYTGAWCGWCPRVTHAIEEVNKTTENVIAVAIHELDSLQNQFTRKMRLLFDVDNFPTAYIDRKYVWDFPEPDNLDQVTDLINTNAPLGIKLSSTVSGNLMKIKATIGFGTTISKGLKFTLMAIEDGVRKVQLNYTDYFGEVTKIDKFVNNDVLRFVFSEEISGGIMSNSRTIKGAIIEKTFESNVPDYIEDVASLSFVAVVSYADTNEVLNAREVKVNESNDFQNN